MEHKELPMALPYEFGGLSGAIHDSASAPFTVPSNMVIYSIVPQPTWTGKATPVEGYEWLTADRTSTGAAVAKYAAVQGAYTAIATTSGECDVYLKPKGSI